MEKQVHKKHGLTVVLDRDRVVPDDPGQDTPAMVYLGNEDADVCATLWCATGEGELDGSRGTKRLNPTQLRWLEEMEELANEFLYAEA